MVGQVGEGDGLAVEESHHLSSTTTIPYTLYNSSRAVLPYQCQGLGGETGNLPKHHLPVNTVKVQMVKGTNMMVVWLVGV